MYRWTCPRSTWIRASRITAAQYRQLSTVPSRFLQVSEEVQQAVAERKPVVALETTIYTHGFPYPDNLHLASRLESLIRDNGGIPATIGILDGIARVGFGHKELDRLVSEAGSPNTLKISRRDLGFACRLKDAEGRLFNGGTTIAGTMILAHLAGIRVFGTGGLGGVHRGAEDTMDVSADLTELGRTPVAVISSGCKSFLDIPRTLEVLETQGVAVATFQDGRCGTVNFPGFYTRESGVPSPKVLKDAAEAAGVIHAHIGLGLQSGFAFANPIPEEHSVPKDVMDAAINEALERAHSVGITGAPVTPFILDKIKQVTGDKSIIANKALVEANVVRATEVAKELSKLEEADAGSPYDVENPGSVVVDPAAAAFTEDGASRGTNAWTASQSTSEPTATSSVNATANSTQASNRNATSKKKPSVFVAGSLAIDLSCDYDIRNNIATGQGTLKPALHTSNPARITQSIGGVAGNVARAAHLLGADVQLCSAVGDDLSGKAVMEGLHEAGMSTEGIKVVTADGARTAQYVAINDNSKDLVMAAADMSIFESASTGSGTITDAFDTLWLPQLREANPTHLVLDGNWPPAYLSRWLEAGKEVKAQVLFEPVSNAKSVGLFELSKAPLATFPNQSVDIMTPNRHEVAAMHDAARSNNFFDRTDWWSVIDALGIPSTGARTQMALATSSQLVDQGIPQQTVQLLPFFPAICTKLGKEGALLTQIIPAGDERLSSGEYAPYILSRCQNGTEESLGVGGVYMRLFPAEEVKEEEVVSVNGAGDTFAGMLVAGMTRNKGKDLRVENWIHHAHLAAATTMSASQSVHPRLGSMRLLMQTDTSR